VTRRKQLGRFRVLFALTALAAGFAGCWLWDRYHGFVVAPLGVPEGSSVQVQRGDSFVAVLRKLRAAGVETGHDLEWQLLARQMGAAGRIQVGEYPLAPAMTPRELLQAMRDASRSWRAGTSANCARRSPARSRWSRRPRRWTTPR
jgi:UPF0755 protein